MAAPPPEPGSQPTPSSSETTKPIHSLVLDTGPLIKNDPPSDALRAKAEQLYTLPVIISEIRDAATRSRVETTLLPFVELRSPRPESVKFVAGFARRTGDLGVLSRPDLEVLALGYELECERNGGNWRLRNTPGQKRVNGRPPQAQGAADSTATREDVEGAETTEAPNVHKTGEGVTSQTQATEESLDNGLQQLHLEASGKEKEQLVNPETAQVEAANIAHEEPPRTDMAEDTLVDGEKADESLAAEEEAENAADASNDDADDDQGGWITPSNLKKHQAKGRNEGSAAGEPAPEKTLQAAVLTSDYAMQNVALRMNLNLVAPSLARVTRLKSWVLRCHGCFAVTRDAARQFCPSCGQPTLLRVSCTTDASGEVRLHLKRNFQWNNRGNVYSVPKPTGGSANGRPQKGAGGKGGWGSRLVLAEDQKEYVRAGEEQRRTKKKDLMDEDALPGILSGARSGTGDKVRVGAGRNVNAKRRR